MRIFLIKIHRNLKWHSHSSPKANPSGSHLRLLLVPALDHFVAFAQTWALVETIVRLPKGVTMHSAPGTAFRVAGHARMMDIQGVEEKCLI